MGEPDAFVAKELIVRSTTPNNAAGAGPTPRFSDTANKRHQRARESSHSSTSATLKRGQRRNLLPPLPNSYSRGKTGLPPQPIDRAAGQSRHPGELLDRDRIRCRSHDRSVHAHHCWRERDLRLRANSLSLSRKLTSIGRNQLCWWLGLPYAASSCASFGIQGGGSRRACAEIDVTSISAPRKPLHFRIRYSTQDRSEQVTRASSRSLAPCAPLDR
jgi:hypothetical protein